jgi:large subunit ribosomal protein L24
MVARIRKNDTVAVLTGKDKNKQGVVLEILSDKNKVLVKNIAIITRHAKARKQGDVSEIKKQESYIDLSNVMLVCNTCRKPSRVNSKLLDTGKRTRVCNRCEQII